MSMPYFAHKNALVETATVGENTRIWAFAHILPGARIGSDCNICDHVFIENDVVVGDRVTVKCGVQLWDGVTLEDDVFVGPNVTFTNDPFPRSRHRPDRFEKTLVQTGASIGANATILPGLVIGRDAMVGAGAVVTKRVPANAIVTGNPARIVGYVSEAPKVGVIRPTASRTEDVRSAIGGVELIPLPVIPDLRGALSYGEVGRHLPFVPKRYFIVFDVGEEVRGEHAHKTLHQLLICVAGSCVVLVDDGRRREEFLLDTPGKGLHIPPMVWGVQYKYSSDAVLLVLASDVYDADDYIRDYEEFLKLTRR